MDASIIEPLKYASGIFAVVAPAIKYFFGDPATKDKELKDRFDRFKTFFEEGGVELHPLLMETAFAAAVGHSKFSASEIPLLIRQKDPMSFIGSYLRVRDHLELDDTSQTLQLNFPASHPILRKAFIALGFVIYLIFVLSPLALLYFYVVDKLLAGSWKSAFSGMLASIFMGVFGVLSLMYAAKIRGAVMLEKIQITEDQSNSSH